MKRTKCFALVVLVLLLAATLVWSEGKQEKPRGRSAAGKLIRFLSSESDRPTVEAYNSIIDAFKKTHPDVNIMLELATFSDATTVVSMQLATGNPPDLFMLNNTEIATYAKMDYLHPLDDMIDRIGRRDFKPGSLMNVEGKNWAVPYAADADAIWVRRDLMEEAGVSAPQTWDDQLVFAQKLTQDKNGDGDIEVYGAVVPAGINGRTDGVVEEYMWQAGGQLFDKDLNVTLDSPECAEAIEFLGKLAEYAPPGIANYSYWQCIEAFVTERSAMTYYPGRVLGQLWENARHLVDVSDAILLPKGPKLRAGYITWNSYAIASNAPDPQLVEDFLTFMITGDRAIEFCNTVPAHNIPALFSLENDPRLFEPEVLQRRPDIGKFFFQEVPKHAAIRYMGGNIQNGKLTPDKATVSPYPMREEAVFSKVFQMHLLQNKTPEEAVAWGAKRTEEIKERYQELFSE